MSGAQSPEVRLKHSVQLSTLCACYGGLLTPKQRQALLLHCDEDLTLAEIAEEMQVSRQSVHELITRSEQKLRRYEAALKLAQQGQETRKALTDAITALDAGQAAESRAILTRLMTMLDEEEPAHGV